MYFYPDSLSLIRNCGVKEEKNIYSRNINQTYCLKFKTGPCTDRQNRSLK